MKAVYSVSDKNQLIITLADKVLKPDGEFVAGPANRLIYLVKEPKDWRLAQGIPERIDLEGRWSLDKNHNLLFSLKKTQTQNGKDRLLLKTELKEARSGSLVFSLGTQGQSSTQELRLLELKGNWQTDSLNRLQLVVKHLNSNSGILTLQGAWQMKRNSIVYTYQETSLVTKKKYTNTLNFKGHWDIGKSRQITYILDLKNNSRFDFKVYCETPSIIAQRGVIKYRVGLGVSGKKLFSPQVITLYGVWKMGRKSGISFEMDYAKSGIKAINFKPFVQLDEATKITLGLRCADGADTGLSLEISRKSLKKQTYWFARLSKDSDGQSIKAGVMIPW